jgi:type I site-specific restriction endonuclease
LKTDKELDFLEEHIPELANSAIKKAYLDTLSAGLSVTNIHNVVFAESFKSDVIIRQSIGRGLRLHADKLKTTIYDIVDNFSIKNGNKFIFKNHLYKHALSRMEIYKEQNFPFKIKEVNLIKTNL